MLNTYKKMALRAVERARNHANPILAAIPSHVMRMQQSRSALEGNEHFEKQEATLTGKATRVLPHKSQATARVSEEKTVGKRESGDANEGQGPKAGRTDRVGKVSRASGLPLKHAPGSSTAVVSKQADAPAHRLLRPDGRQYKWNMIAPPAPAVYPQRDGSLYTVGGARQKRAKTNDVDSMGPVRRAQFIRRERQIKKALQLEHEKEAQKRRFMEHKVSYV